jgi:hypothetical protein
MENPDDRQSTVPPRAPAVGVPDAMYEHKWLVVDYTVSNFPGAPAPNTMSWVGLPSNADIHEVVETAKRVPLHNPNVTVNRIGLMRTVPNFDQDRPGYPPGYIVPYHQGAIVHPDHKTLYDKNSQN